MTSISIKLVTNELIKQNPWWESSSVMAEDISLPKRDVFEKIYRRVTANNLITAVTGLRRIGKTTLIRQVINDLLKTYDRQKILFYSFDNTSINQSEDLLAAIVEYHRRRFPADQLYLFLDEIQYVDRWNAILKKYVDLYPQLKFIVTGSSTLFIKTQARESLAGRILDTVMRPLHYGEYLKVAYGLSSPDPEDLKRYFEEYLSWGEFPYLHKLESWQDKKEYVLDWVINRVLQTDLPKLQRINRPEKLLATSNALIEGSGQLVEILNLATDLQIARDTLSDYIYLFEQAYLIHQIYNKNLGYRTRPSRQRKIYSCSTNAVVFKNTSGITSDAFSLKIGQLVETFIHNYYLGKGEELYFWREGQAREVDFIVKRPGILLPIEVKYKSHIRPDDLKNLLRFCNKANLSQAQVITKDKSGEETVGGIKISYFPASSLTS